MDELEIRLQNSQKRARWRWKKRLVKRLPVLIAVLLGILVLGGTGVLAYVKIEPMIVDSGVAREYWIAAVPVSWNIVPTGKDAMTGETLQAKNTTFEALRYVAYTPNWGRPLPDTSNGGIQGPTLYAQVGDQFLVHFKNLDTYYKRPHSMHAHGVHYTPAYDGSYVSSNIEPGSAVPVGGQYTYKWTVGTDSLGVWVYHDHSVDAADNDALGLYGNLVITQRGQTQPDKRFFVFFGELMPSVTGLPQMYYTINGRAYLGNLPPYRAKVGDHVEWVVSSLGNAIHLFHIHGHRWLYNNRYQDDLLIGPGQAIAVDFVEDNVGDWLVHCHIDIHMMMGMVAQYDVSP
jgi:manganese oxidase